MSRYFFDVLTVEGLLRDDEGLELTSTSAVKAEVARISADIARDEIADRNSLMVRVSVRDIAFFQGELAFDSGWINPA